MGFDAEGFDEMEYARIAARHFQTAPREYYVTAADVVNSIPRSRPIATNPSATPPSSRPICVPVSPRTTASTSCSPAMAAMRSSAAMSAMPISGSSNSTVKRQHLSVRCSSPRSVCLPLGVIPPVRKARSYIDQAKVPLPDRFETYNFLHRTALEQIFQPGFLARVDSAAPLQNLREVYARTASGSAINRMMHLDLKITLADNDLRKVNQACGLAGIDVRYPLLDDRMLDFAASIPPNMQLKRTQLRWFFKQALAEFLPPEIIGKRKQGFGLPVGLWMADYAPPRERTHESIPALKRRGIVRPDYIDWVERKQPGSMPPIMASCCGCWSCWSSGCRHIAPEARGLRRSSRGGRMRPNPLSADALGIEGLPVGGPILSDGWPSGAGPAGPGARKRWRIKSRRGGLGH